METYFENIESHLAAEMRAKLMQDLRLLATDAEELLKATAGETGQEAQAARARLTQSIQRSKSTYQRLQQQTLEGARAAVRKADLVIREHPYHSAGLAFGLGVLLGVLVSRR
jgi:ElaB/YqjD/DUF883 family membrane-anchored ribosome-binding protein